MTGCTHYNLVPSASAVGDGKSFGESTHPSQNANHSVVCEDDQNRQRAGVISHPGHSPHQTLPLTFSVRVIGEQSNFTGSDWSQSLV